MPLLGGVRDDFRAEDFLGGHLRGRRELGEGISLLGDVDPLAGDVGREVGFLIRDVRLRLLDGVDNAGDTGLIRGKSLGIGFINGLLDGGLFHLFSDLLTA